MPPPPPQQHEIAWLAERPATSPDQGPPPIGKGSHYAGLPIYRAAADLALAIELAVGRMARRHQFGLGQHLRDHAISLLVDVARANRRSGRLEVLDRMCDSAECLKVLLEHGRQLQAFGSFADYAALAQKTVDVARQAEGWRRHTCSGPERPRRPSASEGP